MIQVGDILVFKLNAAQKSIYITDIEDHNFSFTRVLKINSEEVFLSGYYYFDMFKSFFLSQDFRLFSDSGNILYNRPYNQVLRTHCKIFLRGVNYEL